MPLNIGKISFANVVPVFYLLEREADCTGYRFIEGYPSVLNRMLREGKLDLSPSSSIEYLRDKELYRYLPGHSISARGRIDSILLFSRVPIESLDGQTVYATHQSETSVALLHIVLKKFYNLDCNVKSSNSPFSEAIASHSAYLSIGDEALSALFAANKLDPPSNEPDATMATLDHQLFYIYDLSDLWHKRTGLPFVFALWIVHRDLNPEKLALLEQFNRDLDLARDAIPSRLEEIATESGLSYPRQELIDYWRGIIYGLDEDCLKGLDLFEQYIKEMGLL